MDESTTASSIISTITETGEVRVRLVDQDIAPLAADEILIRIEASAINPSDMTMMLGPVDPASLHIATEGGGPVIVGRVPEDRLWPLKHRIGTPLAIGNEGAGTIIDAGDNARDLIGKRCAGLLGGGMFSTLRVAKADQVVILPDGVPAEAAAGLFVNPLTVVAMIETMRRDGHKAIVHSAAASNLGQMLIKYCEAEGVPIIALVRSEAQVSMLRQIGARWVLNTSSDEFGTDLLDAIKATQATAYFDALGGGTLTDHVLKAMERAQIEQDTGFRRYGSAQAKHVYVYSTLDPGPTILTRAYGMRWGVSAYVLTNILQDFGPEAQKDMTAKVIKNIGGIFASSFAHRIGLAELFDVAVLNAILKRATGKKYLIVP